MTGRRRWARTRMVPRAVALTLAAFGVVACGVDGDRTALAIRDVEVELDGALTVTTECAVIQEVTVGDDHSGTGLPEVTVWGRPQVGRCETTASVDVPGEPTKIVDGTTSMVIDLDRPAG